MKGKLELRFLAPNTGKIRTRLEEVHPEFTQELRAAISNAAAKTIEAHQTAFKGHVIDELDQMVKDGKIKFAGKHEDNVFNVTQDFLSIYVEATKEAFDARFPEEPKPKPEKDDKVLKAKPAKAKPKAEVKEAFDEFED